MRFFERMECVTLLMLLIALMDVNLLLGTEQALMLHSISTNSINLTINLTHSIGGIYMFRTVVTS